MLDSSSLRFAGQYVQIAGQTVLNGGVIYTNIPLDIQDGSLMGNGIIVGNVSNNGTLSPGVSNSGGIGDGSSNGGILGDGSVRGFNPAPWPGVVEVHGTYAQVSAGNFAVDIGGLTPGNLADQHDQLKVFGMVALDGTLDIGLINRFTPSVGDTITIIDNDGMNAVNGTFAGLPESDCADGTGSYLFRISYQGGDNNDVTLTMIRTNQAPTADAGDSYSIGEGGTLLLDASGSADPDGDPLTYSWDVNGDGVFGDAIGVTSSLTWSQLQILGIDDGLTSFAVQVRVSDGYSHFVDSTSATLTITNTAPIATLSNGGTVYENTAGMVSFSSPFDPSDTDTAAGFTYSYDFDNDGTYEVVDSTSATATVPASYLADGPGNRTVQGRITDKDGGYTECTTTLAINNVAPAASISGPTNGVPGQPRTITFSAIDSSTVDQAAGFTYAINWEDGTPLQTINRKPGNGSGVAVDHVYTAPGAYDIQVVAFDKDDGASISFIRTQTIQRAELQGNDIAIGGTLGNDTITISPDKKNPANLSVSVKTSNTALVDNTFHSTGHILVYGQAGDDVILVQSNKIKGTTYYVTVPALLYGGDGKDTLDVSGSTANNVLSGDADDDHLFGSVAGHDLLIGGIGGDKLDASNSGGDLLIGGTTDFDLASTLTNYDMKLVALYAIMAEWGRTDLGTPTDPSGYLARVHHLDGSLSDGLGLNGLAFLNSTTVHEDGTSDTLTGSLTSLDWFFALLAGAEQDVIKKQQLGEILTGL